MNSNVATWVSITIAVVSAVLALFTIVRMFIRVRNSKHLTITKKTGEHITVSREYNKEDSKKLLEFMK